MTLDEPVGEGAEAAARQLDGVVAALRAHNIEVVVVKDGEEARTFVLGLIPEGA